MSIAGAAVQRGKRIKGKGLPDIRIELVSQRNRRVDDKVLEADIEGTHYVHPLDVKRGRGYVLADVVPGRYRATIAVDGFRRSTGQFGAKAKRNQTFTWKIPQRCTRLPAWGELDQRQQRLLRSFAGARNARRVWNQLADNQACTFFQVTYALARTAMGEAVLSDYIQRVRVIGGAEIVARAEDGRERKATGWRLHVAIKPSRRGSIAPDLVRHGFKADKGFVHPTHTRFGFTKSFRQQGRNPRLQMVLRADGSGADVDLDNGAFHRSSPMAVYGALKKRFPGVERIYRVE